MRVSPAASLKPGIVLPVLDVEERGSFRDGDSRDETAHGGGRVDRTGSEGNGGRVSLFSNGELLGSGGAEEEGVA